MSRHFQGVLVAILAAVTYGLYPPAAKVAYKAGANAAYVIIVTTFLRAIALWLYSLARKRRVVPSRGEWRDVISGGFFQSLSVFGIIGSLAYLPGPVTIIIVFSHTIMLLLFLAYKGEIKLTGVAIGTTCSALLGLTLVVDVWHVVGDPLRLTGIALALLSAFATVSRLYVFGKQVLETNPAVVGARIFSAAALFTLLLVPFITPVGPRSLDGHMWVAACALSLIGGTFAMFYGIALIGSFQFSLMIKLEPLCTALFSVLITGELLHPTQYFGMFLVVVSLVCYQLFDTANKHTVGTTPLPADGTSAEPPPAPV